MLLHTTTTSGISPPKPPALQPPLWMPLAARSSLEVNVRLANKGLLVTKNRDTATADPSFYATHSAFCLAGRVFHFAKLNEDLTSIEQAKTTLDDVNFEDQQAPAITTKTDLAQEREKRKLEKQKKRDEFNRMGSAEKAAFIEKMNQAREAKAKPAATTNNGHETDSLSLSKGVSTASILTSDRATPQEKVPKKTLPADLSKHDVAKVDKPAAKRVKSVLSKIMGADSFNPEGECIVNPQRREEIFIPTSVGVYINASTTNAAQFEETNFEGFNFYTFPVCLFGPALKAGNQQDKWFKLVKHHLPFFTESEKITSIVHEEGANPYELAQWNTMERVADFIMQTSTIGIQRRDLEKESRKLGKVSSAPAVLQSNKEPTNESQENWPELVCHLPDADYILSWLKLYLHGKLDRELLGKACLLTFSERKKYEKKIRELFAGKPIKLKFISPFDDVFDLIRQEFIDDGTIGREMSYGDDALSGALNSIPSLDVVSLPDPNIVPQEDEKHTYLRVAGKVLSLFKSIQEVGPLTSIEQKEQEVVAEIMNKLKSTQDGYGPVWTDVLSTRNKILPRNFEELFHDANLVAVAHTARRKSHDVPNFKTCMLAPLLEKQIVRSYEKEKDKLNDAARTDGNSRNNPYPGTCAAIIMESVIHYDNEPGLGYVEVSNAEDPSIKELHRTEFPRGSIFEVGMAKESVAKAVDANATKIYSNTRRLTLWNNNRGQSPSSSAETIIPPAAAVPPPPAAKEVSPASPRPHP